MSCMAVVVYVGIDPRIPTMPGRSTSEFSPTKQTMLIAPSFARRREVVRAIRMRGELFFY